MFKKILITGFATLGLLSAMQVSAHTVQNHGHHHNAPPPKPTYNITVNINLLLNLINNGVRNNSLSHHEEKLCRQDYSRITNLRVSYNRGGMQDHEHRDLERHIRNAQKRTRDYSANSQRRVQPRPVKPRVIKRHRPQVIHAPVVHAPVIWVQPQHKPRKHRNRGPRRGHRMNRHHRGHRMNRHHRGNRQGVTLRNRHGAVRINKHGIKIRIGH